LPIGLAITVLLDKRTQIYEQFKIEEIRARRIAFFASQWLDHKGKGFSDLYPLPWEVDEHKKLDKDTAAMAALELQRRLQGKVDRKMKKDGITTKARR